MLRLLSRLLFGTKEREPSCTTWCPRCRNVLNDGRSGCHESEGLVNFHCCECEFWSVWDFDAPVPLYLHEGGQPPADAGAKDGAK